MKIPWLDLLLLVVILGSAISALRSGITRSVLQAEHDRLAARIGRIAVEDPQRIYVRALTTDDPLEFAWRIYLPPNYRYQFEVPGDGRSWGSHTDAVHAIVRARIREENGERMLYFQFPGSSSLTGIDPELNKLLHGRWDRLQFEQEGRDGQVSFATDESISLLRLSLPDDVLQEAKQKLSAAAMSRCTPYLTQIVLRPPDSQP